MATVGVEDILLHLIEQREPRAVYERFVATHGQAAGACDPEMLLTRKMLTEKYAQEAVQTVGKAMNQPLLAGCTAQQALQFMMGTGPASASYRESSRSTLFDYLVDPPTGELGQPAAYPSTDGESIARLAPFANASSSSRARFVGDVAAQVQHVRSPGFVVDGKPVASGAAATAAVGVCVQAAREDPVTLTHALRGAAVLRHALPNSAPRCSFISAQMSSEELAKQGFVSPFCRLEWAHPLSRALFRLLDRIAIAVADAVGLTRSGSSFVDSESASYKDPELAERASVWSEWTASLLQGVVEATFAALATKPKAKGKKGKRRGKLSGPMALLARDSNPTSLSGSALAVTVTGATPAELKPFLPAGHPAGGGAPSEAPGDEKFVCDDGETVVTKRDVVSQLVDDEAVATRKFATRPDGRQNNKKVGHKKVAGPGFRAGGASDLYAGDTRSGRVRNAEAVRFAAASADDLQPSCLNDWASSSSSRARADRRRSITNAIPELIEVFRLHVGEGNMQHEERMDVFERRLHILQALTFSLYQPGAGDLASDAAEHIPFPALVTFCHDFLVACKKTEAGKYSLYALELVDMCLTCLHMLLDPSRSESTRRQAVENLDLAGGTARILWAIAVILRDYAQEIMGRGKDLKEMANEANEMTCGALNAIVKVLTGLQQTEGVGLVLLDAHGGAAACAATVVEVVAPLSQFGQPAKTAVVIATALSVWTREIMDGVDLMESPLSRVRSLFLNHGIMAFLCAAVHPSCKDAGLTEPNTAATAVWFHSALQITEYLGYLAVQHPELCIRFGVHCSALAMLQAHAEILQIQAENGAADANTHVSVTGLQRAAELNGQSGQILAWKQEKQRYNVRLGSGRTLAVKPANLLDTSGQPVQVPPTVDEAVAKALDLHPLIARMETHEVVSSPMMAGIDADSIFASCAILLANLTMYGLKVQGVHEHLARASTVSTLCSVFVKRVRCIKKGRVNLRESEASLLNQIARCLGPLSSIPGPGNATTWTHIIAQSELQAAPHDLGACVRRLLRDVDSRCRVPEQISLLRHLTTVPKNLCEAAEDEVQRIAAYGQNIAALMSVVAGTDGRDFQDPAIVHNSVQQVMVCMLQLGEGFFNQGLPSSANVLPDTREEAASLLPAFLQRVQSWMDRSDLGGAPQQFLQVMNMMMTSPEQIDNVRKQIGGFGQTELQRPPGCVTVLAEFKTDAAEADAKTAVGSSCVNCGVAEIAPGTKLKKCAGENCNAQYCSQKCQRTDWDVCNHSDVCGAGCGPSFAVASVPQTAAEKKKAREKARKKAQKARKKAAQQAEARSAD